jgi:hypothetical protein
MSSNLADFAPNGKLGEMFARAKFYNQINQQLPQLLPAVFSSLELCTINENVAVLTSNNQAVAFRAKQQSGLILQALQQIQPSENITSVVIKIDA